MSRFEEKEQSGHCCVMVEKKQHWNCSIKYKASHNGKVLQLTEQLVIPKNFDLLGNT